MIDHLVLRVFWGIAQATCVGFSACVLLFAAKGLAPGHRVWMALVSLTTMAALPVLMLLPLDSTFAQVRGLVLGSGQGLVAIHTIADLRQTEPVPQNTERIQTPRHPSAWWAIGQSGARKNESANVAISSEPSADRTASGPAQSVPWSWLGLCAIFAAIGSGVLRLAFGWVQVRQLLGRCREIHHVDLTGLISDVAQQLRVTARLACRVSSELTTPAVVGWRRPVLLLPGDWQQWTHGQLRSAVAHELAHVRRHDPLWNATAQAALALNYFHPLAHWLMRNLRLDQELAADRLAAPLAGGRQRYLESIAELALRQADARMGGPVLAFVPSRGTLLRRLQMVRQLRLQHSRRASALAVLAIGVLLAVAGAVATIRPGLAQGPDVASHTPRDGNAGSAQRTDGEAGLRAARDGAPDASNDAAPAQEQHEAAAGQDASAYPLAFHDALRRFADSRAKVKSYELIIRIKEDVTPQLTTDGKVSETPEKPPIQLEIVADLEADNFLVAQHGNTGEGDGSKVQPLQINATTPELTITVQGERGWISAPSNRRRPQGFFDPLALGVAALGDMRRGTLLKEIIGNYMDWWPMHGQALANRIVQYGEDDGEQTYLLHLDSERGYSPVRLRDRTGYGGVFRVEQELRSVRGHWLPASAIVSEPEQVRHMEFEWRSINSQLRDRFSPRQIEARYGVQLTDRR